MGGNRGITQLATELLVLVYKRRFRLVVVDIDPIWVTIEETKEAAHFISAQVRSKLQKNLTRNLHIQSMQTLENLNTGRSIRLVPQAKDPDISVQHDPLRPDSHGLPLLHESA